MNTIKDRKQIQPIHPNRINNQIRAARVRLVGVEGEQFGVVSLRKAIEKAEEVGVDLVEISPNSEPPVCRVMDYGKFLYERSKSSKEQKKKQKTIQVKEIKFRISTDESDYQIKLRNIVRFLKEGDKTKVTMRFRGREISHQGLGINMLNRVKKDLSELAIVESFSLKVEGKQIFMILAPKKNSNRKRKY